MKIAHFDRNENLLWIKDADHFPSPAKDAKGKPRTIVVPNPPPYDETTERIVFTYDGWVKKPLPQEAIQTRAKVQAEKTERINLAKGMTMLDDLISNGVTNLTQANRAIKFLARGMKILLKERLADEMREEELAKQAAKQETKQPKII